MRHTYILSILLASVFSTIALTVKIKLHFQISPAYLDAALAEVLLEPASLPSNRQFPYEELSAELFAKN